MSTVDVGVVIRADVSTRVYSAGPHALRLLRVTLSHMPFVKVDTRIVDSSLWVERDARSIFLTAMFSAVPYELSEATPQIEVASLALTGWTIPPGWYGLVEASVPGLIRKDGCELDVGLRALALLGAPDHFSRSPEYDGRRLVRITGGFLVLNYFKYRDRDYTASTRMRRMRERQAQERERQTQSDASGGESGDSVTRIVTEAESREQRAESITKDPEHASSESGPAALVRRATGTVAKRSTAASDAILMRLSDVLAEIATKSKRTVSADELRRMQAEMVFLYWGARFGHANAVLDKKRETRIVARLKENESNVSELLYALDGAARDPWIMGTAPNSPRKYDGIETIFRDRAQVERFANTMKRFRDGEPHKLIPRLEAAMRGDSEVHDSEGT